MLTDGPRPSQSDIVELRFLMLEYVRQLVLRGSGVQDDELQSIMNFLTTIHEVCSAMRSVMLSTCTVLILKDVICWPWPQGLLAVA